MPSILFVFTSADKTLTGKQTGYYLPEAAHPYYILSPHASIDFASPKGPNPPIDEGSARSFSEIADCIKFLSDDAVKTKLSSAKKLSDVNINDYDAVFYVGGHGPIIDLSQDPINAQVVSDFWNAGKIVSAVCHGTAALVGGVDTAGKSILSGRNVTGFSNAEEIAIDGVKGVPFLLEDKIVELGGKYAKAENLWKPKVIVDGQLITGQNPASAQPIGDSILKALTASE